VRARILDRLAALQRERDLAMVFVTHDLDVVRGIADEVLVLQEGRVVESGTVSRVFDEPRHPFTRELLSAAGLSPAGPGATA
jgi:peptide/nickel transport system ATP-binding protein